MEITYRSELDFYIFGRTTAAYPLGFAVVGEEQIPLLRRLGPEIIPEELVCFDQPSRVSEFAQAGLHFFAQDRKFQSVLIHPEKYVEKFSPYQVILTPDVTLSADMPPSVRIQNIRASRQAGAVWESRGLNVVPSVRWSSKEDYEVAFSGIPLNSVVAVGTYGATRDRALRKVLLDGLEVLVDKVLPVAILIYGALDNRQKIELEKLTYVRQYAPAVWSRESPIELNFESDDLFTGLDKSQIELPGLDQGIDESLRRLCED